MIDLQEACSQRTNTSSEKGQIIDAETTAKWIRVRVIKIQDGLNPVDNGDTSPTGRAPIYLAQIFEQDYMIQNGKQLLN